LVTSSEISRQRESLLINPGMLEPATPGFEVVGCFNPAFFRSAGNNWLIFRVAECPPRNRRDHFPSPRVQSSGGKLRVIVDQIPCNLAIGDDPRSLKLPDGHFRLRFLSHLRIAQVSDDGMSLIQIQQKPWLFPAHNWEEFGVEDPRATIVDRQIVVTYVSVSRQMGIAPALLKVDRSTLAPKRLGIFLPSENKDVTIFPRKSAGRFVALHRPMAHDAFAAPNIQLASSPDLLNWGGHRLLMSPNSKGWDSYRIGGGPPPIKVSDGWLLIYHGVQRRKGDPVGIYCVGAALLDEKYPHNVLARAKRPILKPLRKWEKKGFTPNVIFPTGSLLRGDQLILFCGAADSCVSSITVSLKELLGRLSAEPK
jgi:beta-1,2-mannobiose phosphorylase / 1,2-beta-oligomannan phosphorylase